MIVRTSSIVVDIVVPTIVVSIFLSVCRGKIRTIVVALIALLCTILQCRYDLKGSLAGRLTSPKACKQGAVQKDLNLLESGMYMLL